MSNVNCPFDNQYCSDKDRRFSAWAEIVMTYTMPSIIGPNTFSGCPDEKNCPRNPAVLTQNRITQQQNAQR